MSRAASVDDNIVRRTGDLDVVELVLELFNPSHYTVVGPCLRGVIWTVSGSYCFRCFTNY